MIRTFIAFTLLVASSAFAYQSATPQEFAELATQDDVIVIDVRTPEEIVRGKIEHASELNLFDPTFSEKILKLQTDKKILVYCRSGGRSSEAAKILESKGFTDIVNLSGGIAAWQKAKLPLTKPKPGSRKKAAPPLSQDDFEKRLQTSRTVLLDFHTEWCSPCRRMAPVIDTIEDQHGKSISVIRIDADSNPDLASQYDVTAVPTFVILKSGEETWRQTGITPIEDLLAAAK